MSSILAFVFVLGVLVFVHELGHFLAARRIGVRVLTFSLGFGPKLIAFTRGDTEYCVSAIPLGGYVKMAGENPEEARTGAPDEFLSKTKWQRFQVLVMGPVMNLALAWLVLAGVLYQGVQMPASDYEPAIVASVTPSSPAAQAGIQPGDRIAGIGGEPIANWEDFEMAVLPKANRQLALDVDRAGARTRLTVTPRATGKYDVGDIGVLRIEHPVILATNQGEPAQEGGLQAHDVVMAVDGERDPSSDRLISAIRDHEGRPLDLEVMRNGAATHITVTPRKIDGLVRIGAPIGQQSRVVQPGAVEALTLSAERNWQGSKQIVKTLGGLFTRETSVKQLMGPVAIGRLSGDAVEQGWAQLFGLMAMISLNLGLLNLMPVPVLDGGHIAILALEGLARHDLSMKVKEKMLLAGFALLLTLMATVIYNDLMRLQWVQRLVPWG